MKYIEITIHTLTEAGELVSDILWDYSTEGVAIYDFNDILELAKDNKAWDYIDENLVIENKEVLVKVYVQKENISNVLEEITERVNALREFVPVGSLEINTKEVEGDEWLTKWKEYFKPIKIGKVVVCPNWLKYEQKPDETVIKIESNMAFGTGEHETTSMCVELLQKYINKDTVLLDVGCGSGILGITACLLGISKAIMTDIDECAIEATTQNMEVNNIKNGEVLLKNLLDDNSIKGDIIVANIMAEVLVMFSKDIKNNLKENGVIILSGILLSKEKFVLDAYINAGFTPIEIIRKGEWVAIALKYGKV